MASRVRRHTASEPGVRLPTYAAYLNLIEPWWKVLRSLAATALRFNTWTEVCQAVEEATSELDRAPPPLRLGATPQAPPWLSRQHRQAGA